MQGGKCIGAASLTIDLPTLIGTVTKGSASIGANANDVNVEDMAFDNTTDTILLIQILGILLAQVKTLQRLEFPMLMMPLMLIETML